MKMFFPIHISTCYRSLSFGASDDAASCCVMIEILRVLSQQEKRLRHSVIFLFNGAEETPLQAAHGFITQHAWAKDIRGNHFQE